MRKTALLLAIILFLSGSATQASIEKVPRRFHLFRFYGSWAEVYGSSSETAGGKLRFSSPMKNSNFLESTWSTGVEYGVLYSRHFLVGFGFRYTPHNTQDWIFDTYGVTYDLRQYDLEINLNYIQFDLAVVPFSPYAGLSFQTGIVQFKPRNFATEWSFSSGASVNFGADVTIFKAGNDLSFLTISSDNRYDVWSTEGRPKYLHTGISLNYYYK